MAKDYTQTIEFFISNETSIENLIIHLKFFNNTQIMNEGSRLYCVNLIENRLHDLNYKVNSYDYEPLKNHHHAYLGTHLFSIYPEIFSVPIKIKDYVK